MSAISIPHGSVRSRFHLIHPVIGMTASPKPLPKPFAKASPRAAAETPGVATPAWIDSSPPIPPHRMWILAMPLLLLFWKVLLPSARPVPACRCLPLFALP